jgi:hypothetical protein
MIGGIEGSLRHEHADEVLCLGWLKDQARRSSQAAALSSSPPTIAARAA